MTKQIKSEITRGKVKDTLTIHLNSECTIFITRDKATRMFCVYTKHNEGKRFKFSSTRYFSKTRGLKEEIRELILAYSGIH